MRRMRPYIVRQGDYLARVAAVQGVSLDTIRTHPGNTLLGALRGGDEVLAPGDALFVPEPTAAAFVLELGAQNHFQAPTTNVTVSVVLRDGETPLANEPYYLEGLLEYVEDRTNSTGALTFEVPHGIVEVRVHLFERGYVLPLLIAHVDPVDTEAGLRARLANLGMLALDAWQALAAACFPTASATVEDAEALRQAVMDFQRRCGLQVTGEACAATREALLETYGA